MNITPAATIVTWLSGIMLQAAPPERAVMQGTPDRDAVIQAERTRYEEFAEDVALVAYDPAEAPLYSGPHARAKTAVVLLATAFYESGFRKDVDLGIGPRSRGDSGRSCTAFQFNLGAEGRTRAGHSCSEMYADRTLAVRSALAVLRSSMRMCQSLAPEYRLSAYTAGRCEDGQAQSKMRVETARKWLGRWAVPVTDNEAVEEAGMTEKAMRGTLARD